MTIYSDEDEDATLGDDSELVNGDDESTLVENTVLPHSPILDVPSVPDFGAPCPNSLFEHDSLNGSDETEFITCDAAQLDEIDNLVVSGRPSLSTNAIKRLSDDGMLPLRAVSPTESPFTVPQSPEVSSSTSAPLITNPSHIAHATTDTIIEEDEDLSTSPSPSNGSDIITQLNAVLESIKAQDLNVPSRLEVVRLCAQITLETTK